MGFVRHTNTERGVTAPPHETIYTAPEMRETRVEERGRPETGRDERVVAGLLGGGASTEVLAGGAAVALSIIALAGGAPLTLGGIACICLGGGLLVFSGAVGARWRDTSSRVIRERSEGADVIGGLGAEALGGAAGVVLGILTLIGVAPVALFSIAVLCLGGGMLFGGAGQSELDVLATDPNPRRNRMSIKAMKAGGGIMAVAGIGGIVLGILGIIGVTPTVTLSLVGTLALGAGLFFAGAAGALRFGPTLLHARTA